MMVKTMREKHQEMMRDPEYAIAYLSLGEDFALAKTMIEARIKAKLAKKRAPQKKNGA